MHLEKIAADSNLVPGLSDTYFNMSLNLLSFVHANRMNTLNRIYDNLAVIIAGYSEIAVQEEQLGTGHAVQSALPLISPDAGTVGIFSGDTPLLSPQIVHDLTREHFVKEAYVTLLTAELSDPSGYGRIVRDGEGLVERIVEEKDAGPRELAIREINAGAYIFNRTALEESLVILRNDNAQGEFYLTDTITLIRAGSRQVAAFKAPGDATEVLGVNTVEQLIQADLLLRERES